MDWIEPQAPDHGPIALLHRGHDGYVSLASKATGEHEHVRSLKVRELDGMFPQFRERLEQDAFFSINGMHRPGPPSKKRARWLTSVWADLDCYNLGMTVGRALGALVDAQEAGEIPPVSMFQRSGRGLWAFWFLKNDIERHGPIDGPVRAWPEQVEKFVALENGINRRFASLYADSNATDVARIARVPGSINTKAGGSTRVSYWIQASDAGEFYAYTPEELAGAFGIALPDRRRLPAPVRQALTQEEREKKRRGHAGRWVKAVNTWKHLRARRGKFTEGHRYYAVWVWCCLLSRCSTLDTDEPVPRMTDEKIRREAKRIAEECCSPPLEESDWKTAFENRKSLVSRVRNQTLSNWLKVTPEESEEIRAVIGAAWPPAFVHQGEPAPRVELTRAEERAHRREWIEANVDPADVPTLRELRRMIEEKIGLAATEATLMNDLKALGISNPRRHGRKREHPELPLG